MYSTNHIRDFGSRWAVKALTALPTKLIRPAEQIWSFARILPRSTLLASGQDADTYQLWGYPIQYTIIQDVGSMPRGSGHRLLAHHAYRPLCPLKANCQALETLYTRRRHLFFFSFSAALFSSPRWSRGPASLTTSGVLVTLVYKSNTHLSISVHKTKIQKLYPRDRLAVS